MKLRGCVSAVCHSPKQGASVFHCFGSWLRHTTGLANPLPATSVVGAVSCHDKARPEKNTLVSYIAYVHANALSRVLQLDEGEFIELQQIWSSEKYEKWLMSEMRQAPVVWVVSRPCSLLIDPLVARFPSTLLFRVTCPLGPPLGSPLGPVLKVYGLYGLTPANTRHRMHSKLSHLKHLTSTKDLWNLECQGKVMPSCSLVIPKGTWSGNWRSERSCWHDYERFCRQGLKLLWRGGANPTFWTFQGSWLKHAQRSATNAWIDWLAICCSVCVAVQRNFGRAKVSHKRYLTNWKSSKTLNRVHSTRKARCTNHGGCSLGMQPQSLNPTNPSCMEPLSWAVVTVKKCLG